MSGALTHSRRRLSAVILARNEEARIERCLKSIAWADEIIVIDGESTDATAEICRKQGARVITHCFEGSFAQERNLGMEAATGDWVLQIDADDIVTPAFRAAMEHLLKQPQTHQAFKFRRKSFLLGRWMRFGGWYHYLPNLLRREVRYEGLVHERPRIAGSIGVIDADIEHHPCGNLEGFLHRHNRYTALSVQEMLTLHGRMEESEIRRNLIRRPWKTFWKSYVKKQGFREGIHGLVFAWFYAMVEFIKWAKYWEAVWIDAETVRALTRKAADSAAPRRPPARKNSLCVCLMTKNEAEQLSACLDRVKDWADEIVIIDDESTDGTVELARWYTDRVYSYASNNNHDLQWNRGITHSTADWILHIDADERVSPTLRQAVDKALEQPEGFGAFEMMRLNFFLGRPMRHGGWYHRHRVLFRREAARCAGQGIHVKLEVAGRIGLLDAELEHYPFSSLAQFIERQNSYTTVEASVMAKEQGSAPLKKLRYHLSVRPVKLFWKSYVKQDGRKEGMHGLVFAALYSFMHVLHWAKYWEQLRASECR